MIGHGPWQATVYALFGTLTATVLMTKMGPIASIRDLTKEPPPEGRPFRRYSSDLVRTYLNKAGTHSVKFYRRALLQDIPFLLLYGSGFILLIDGTLGRLFHDPGNGGRLALDAIGALAPLVDAVEDVLLLHSVPPDGEVHPRYTAIANAFTFLKWSSIAAAALAIGTGTMLIALRGTGWL